MKQIAANSGIAFVGSILTYLFGGWSQLLALLFFIIIADYITGLMASIIEGKGLSSAIGYKGLIKKFGIVLLVALGYQLDKNLGTDVIMAGTIYFFLANELISIVENYGRMGLPLPPQITNVIKVLRDKQ
jgi:toxin secretion/phage lysis holin